MANLIFLRQLKEIAQADELTYTANDARFNHCIRAATQTIEKLLGRSLTKASYTEILDVKRNNYNTGYDIYGSSSSGYLSQEKLITIPLKAYPIDVETVTVNYDPTRVFDVSTQLDSSGFSVDPELGVLTVHYLIGACPRALKVSYTAGYEATVDTDDGVEFDADASPPQEMALSNNLPDDLIQAALIQAFHTFDKLNVSNINVKYSRGEGSTNTTAYVNIAGIAAETMAICVQRRRPRIGVI